MTLRRDFLAFTAGAVAARTVIPAVARADGSKDPIIARAADNDIPADHPDAELIATCAAFDELEREYQAALEGDDSDAECDRVHTAQQPLVDRMCELRASTFAGHVSRAHSIAMWAPDLVREGATEDFAGWLSAALLRDLLAGPRLEAITAMERPDAHLLELCALFHKQFEEVEAFPSCETKELQTQFNDMLERRRETSWAVVDMHPSTHTGLRAKARVVLALLLENRTDDPEEEDADVTAAISTLRDLAGEVQS